MQRKIVQDDVDGPEVQLIKGWIPDSLAGYEKLEPRFVHLDLDLYAPTKAALEFFWPRLVPGGVLLFHDYGCSLFPGVKKAADEFLKPLGITPIPLCDKVISAVVVKPLDVT